MYQLTAGVGGGMAFKTIVDAIGITVPVNPRVDYLMYQCENVPMYQLTAEV